MKKSKLTIIYSGNDAMFKPLFISMLTILRRTKSNIDFYCLSGDLTDLNPKYISLTKKHAKRLLQLVKQYNKQNTFNIIDCSKAYRNTFLRHDKIDIKHWTPYGVFRLFIDKLNFKGNVLYLDTDVLISNDIAEAFDVNIKDNELCVCHDLPHAHKNNNKWFNAGVMLININQVRKTKLFDKAINYCIDYQPKYWDQDALNLCNSKIMFWNDDYRFNFQPNCPGRKCRTSSKPVITHFYGKLFARPWDTVKFMKRMHRKHNHEWDADYQIIEKEFSK